MPKDDEAIPLTQTETFERSHGSVEAIGDQVIATSHGDILAVESSGVLTLEVGVEGQPTTIGILVYRDGEAGMQGDGRIVRLMPDMARTIAASLLRMAERIDPRRPS